MILTVSTSNCHETIRLLDHLYKEVLQNDFLSETKTFSSAVFHLDAVQVIFSSSNLSLILELKLKLTE